MTARKWIRFPHQTAGFAGEELETAWQRLHRGDREPWPDAARIAKLGRRHRCVADLITARGGTAKLAIALQDAWRAFHSGRFGEAIEHADALGPLAAAGPANKAAGVYATYLETDERRAIDVLEAAVARGRVAVRELPEVANAHYMLAFVLGRLSQRISVMKALAAGYAGEVQRCLDRTLELEPRHADAHIALGLYNAEIVAKVGALAGRLTHGASADAAIRHFERALALEPQSAVAHVEFARGLLLLDERGNGARARELQSIAAALAPADAMEKLDVERARAALAGRKRR